MTDIFESGSDEDSEDRYKKLKKREAGTNQDAAEERFQELKEEAKQEFIERQEEREKEEEDEEENEGFVTY